MALVFLPGVAAAGESAGPAATETPIRLAFTRTIFPEFNESDARASVKAWVELILKDRGLPADSNTPILDNAADLLTLLKAGKVDMAGITTQEYAVLRDAVKFDCFTAAVCGGEIAEEYQLLVSAASGVTNLAGLQGGKLNVLHSSRMALATLWLDTLLLEARLQPAAGFFSQITPNNKPARVILPLFFHQVDACLVLRRNFEMMRELNPQVGKELRVLAQSEKLVPALTAMRADFTPTYRARFYQEITRLHTTVAGQQLLNVFQSDRIELCPPEKLESALALIARNQKLTAPGHLDRVGGPP